jgi:osmotically-inducible protein OsmY
VAGIISRRDILRVLVRSDEEIRAELDALLHNETLMLDEYRAEVADGTVLLFGPRDPSRRQLAEILARGVPGVVTAGFSDEP